MVEGILGIIFWWLPPGLAVRLHAHLSAALLAPSEKSRLALRVQQLTESRAETVDTQAAELRRIERDLHDGAQARLVSLGMSLALAEDLMERDPDAARALLAEARTTSSAALSELRDLVRGIHPPVLADRGLVGAVQALALAAPIPVTVHAATPRRLPAPVESAAYFAIAEGLTNVIKHSKATAATIEIADDGSELRLEVTRRRRGRRGSGRRHRIARHRAAAVGLRRDAGRGKSARGRHRSRYGAAVRTRLRTVLAEDLALLRDGLIRLLEAHDFEVIEAVDNGPSLLRALTTHRPDVAVVDVRLPPTFTDEGLRAAIEARAQVPGLPVLVLSQYVEQLYARELLADRSGGVGYLLKDRVFNVAQFVDAVRQVAGRWDGDGSRGGRTAAVAAGGRPPGRVTDGAGAGGARADGRGPLQRRDRRPDVHHREGSEQAHQQHLHQARAAAVRGRQPARAGRSRLPGRLVGYVRFRSGRRC